MIKSMVVKGIALKPSLRLRSHLLFYVIRGKLLTFSLPQCLICVMGTILPTPQGNFDD